MNRMSRKTAAFLLMMISSVAIGQTRVSLVSGRLHRIYPGFLEVSTDGKNVTVVKVDSATVYWNGKTDKAGSAKNLAAGDELIIEVIQKNGLSVAQKVRFLHPGS